MSSYVTRTKPYLLEDGTVFYSLQDLAVGLQRMSDDTFQKQKPNVAQWVKQVFEDTNLSHQITQTQTKQQLIELITSLTPQNQLNETLQTLIAKQQQLESQIQNIIKLVFEKSVLEKKIDLEPISKKFQTVQKQFDEVTQKLTLIENQTKEPPHPPLEDFTKQAAQLQSHIDSIKHSLSQKVKEIPTYLEKLIHNNATLITKNEKAIQQHIEEHFQKTFDTHKEKLGALTQAIDTLVDQAVQTTNDQIQTQKSLQSFEQTIQDQTNQSTQTALAELQESYAQHLQLLQKQLQETEANLSHKLVTHITNAVTQHVRESQKQTHTTTEHLQHLLDDVKKLLLKELRIDTKELLSISEVVQTVANQAKQTSELLTSQHKKIDITLQNQHNTSKTLDQIKQASQTAAETTAAHLNHFETHQKNQLQDVKKQFHTLESRIIKNVVAQLPRQLDKKIQLKSYQKELVKHLTEHLTQIGTTFSHEQSVIRKQLGDFVSLLSTITKQLEPFSQIQEHVAALEEHATTHAVALQNAEHALSQIKNQIQVFESSIVTQILEQLPSIIEKHVPSKKEVTVILEQLSKNRSHLEEQLLQNAEQISDSVSQLNKAAESLQLVQQQAIDKLTLIEQSVKDVATTESLTQIMATHASELDHISARLTQIPSVLDEIKLMISANQNQFSDSQKSILTKLTSIQKVVEDKSATEILQESIKTVTSNTEQSTSILQTLETTLLQKIMANVPQVIKKDASLHQKELLDAIHISLSEIKAVQPNKKLNAIQESLTQQTKDLTHTQKDIHLLETHLEHIETNLTQHVTHAIKTISKEQHSAHKNHTHKLQKEITRAFQKAKKDIFQELKEVIVKNQLIAPLQPKIKQFDKNQQQLHKQVDKHMIDFQQQLEDISKKQDYIHSTAIDVHKATTELIEDVPSKKQLKAQVDAQFETLHKQFTKFSAGVTKAIKAANTSAQMHKIQSVLSDLQKETTKPLVLPQLNKLQKNIDTSATTVMTSVTKEFASIFDAVEELQTQHKVLQDLVKQVQSDVKNTDVIAKQVHSLDYADKINTLQDHVLGLDKRINTVVKQFEIVNETNAQHIPQIVEIQNSIDAFSSDLNSIKSALDNINSAQQTIEQSIDNKQENSQNDEILHKLQEHDKLYAEEFAAIKTDLEKLRHADQMDSIQKEIIKLHEKLSENQHADAIQVLTEKIERHDHQTQDLAQHIQTVQENQKVSKTAISEQLQDIAQSLESTTDDDLSAIDEKLANFLNQFNTHTKKTQQQISVMQQSVEQTIDAQAKSIQALQDNNVDLHKRLETLHGDVNTFHTLLKEERQTEKDVLGQFVQLQKAIRNTNTLFTTTQKAIVDLHNNQATLSDQVAELAEIQEDAEKSQTQLAKDVQKSLSSVQKQLEHTKTNHSTISSSLKEVDKKLAAVHKHSAVHTSKQDVKALEQAMKTVHKQVEQSNKTTEQELATLRQLLSRKISRDIYDINKLYVRAERVMQKR